MTRSRLVPALLLLLAPAIARAQSLSLVAVTSSGDCSGASFHQAADASGRYIAAEWAVADGFPVAVNRGRVRCSLRMTVTVPSGYKLVVGGATGAPNRLALARFTPMRLNGASSHALVESAFALDNGSAISASSSTDGGPMTAAALGLDRANTSSPLESVCATATKTSFLLTATVDAATASNYVAPWPPEPYEERERSSMGSVRMFYSVSPCAPTRTAVPSRAGLPQ